MKTQKLIKNENFKTKAIKVHGDKKLIEIIEEVKKEQESK